MRPFHLKTLATNHSVIRHNIAKEQYLNHTTKKASKHEILMAERMKIGCDVMQSSTNLMDASGSTLVIIRQITGSQPILLRPVLVKFLFLQFK
jgi:hypothetical protein